MTAPANKKRTHNDAAREAARRLPKATSERPKTLRKSPYGDKIRALRRKHGQKE